MKKLTDKEVSKIVKHLEADDHKRQPPSRAKVIRLMRSMGVHVSTKINPRDTILWDGDTAHVKGLSISNILHELAHYQVAKPSNRTMLDFGLGRGP
jgi:hypothetical protein